MGITSIKQINIRLNGAIEKRKDTSIMNIGYHIYHEMLQANTHDKIDKALENINQWLDGCGVEAIRDNQFKGYYADIGLLYVNMGDSYAGTIIYDTRKDKWFCCSIGDIVEGQCKRFNV